MQLTELERGLYQLLLRANAPVVDRLTAAQNELTENTTVFREVVAARLKGDGVPIPPESIGVNPETGDILDMRIQQMTTPADDDVASDDAIDVEPTPMPARRQTKKTDA